LITIGVIGKTNVGKSTFFSASTLIEVERANRPFVTINPNIGVSHVRVECVHREFGVKCNPRNSYCINDFRFIPVTLVDVAGLIPGSHEGKGLGNVFLDELRKADVLLHVIDASGSTDERGVPVPPGSRDPIKDVELIENEIDEWFFSIVSKDWDKFSKTVDLSGKDTVESLLSRLSGLTINRSHLLEALRSSKLEGRKLSSWSREELRTFVKNLRRISKPMVIVANKADLPEAKTNIQRLKDRFTHVVPVSAESELALRKASRAGLIEYLPGDSSFRISKALSAEQKRALEYIKTNVLDIYGSTGVQRAINEAVFEALGMITVFPVEDEKCLCDRNGNVLPDALLLKRGSTPLDLAQQIHSDLAKGFLYAMDVRRKEKIGREYTLKDRDVIKIVSTTAIQRK